MDKLTPLTLAEAKRFDQIAHKESPARGSALMSLVRKGLVKYDFDTNQYKLTHAGSVEFMKRNSFRHP